MSRLLSTLIPTICIALFCADARAAKPKQTTAPLVRTATPPDADAKGRMSLREHKAGEDRFKLRAMNIDNALSYEAFVEDAVGAGTFTSVGVLTASLNEPQSASLNFDQRTGPLPLGVANVSDLAGREVQIQNGGQVYLRGMVPDFVVGKKGPAWKRGSICPTRPATPPDDNAKGMIGVRTKMSENRDRFEVKVQRVPADLVIFSVFVDDGVGVMTDVGAMTPSAGDPGAAKLKIDTKSGAPLPFGVFDVEDLEGRALEVRGNDGFTYLAGKVPAFSTGKGKTKARATLTGVGGTGELRLMSHAKAPFEKFELTVNTQVVSGTVDFFMEDPISSTQTLVSQLTTDIHGRAVHKVNTISGAPLPFYVCELADLEGLAIEIRDSGTSAVLMSGTVPGL